MKIHLGRYDGPSPRTYRDLITMGRDHTSGTCCSCHRWSGELPADKRKLFTLSTRANICMECCERKGDEVLGPIQRAEAGARRYARDMIRKKGDLEQGARFYASLAGVSEEFFRAVYAEEKAKP